MISRRYWLATGALAGVAIAATLALATRSKSTPVGQTDLAPVREAPEGEARPAPDPRIEQLERRLAGIEARSADSTAKEVPAPVPDVPAPSIEESKATVRADHGKALEDHRRETIDTSWARDTSEALTTALRPLAASTDGAVVGVDCRSKTCVAEIEWTNFAAANRGWRSVLHGDYDRCSVRVTLDDAVDPERRFRTSVLFTCPRKEAT
jgi:hypothetical protein